jgi:hypothetical protein
MAQLISRKDYKLRFQIRVSVIFYQKSTHQDFLLWLKEQLGYGYLRIRNDGMSEYAIVGLREVHHVLTLLYPFLRLKKTLARDVLYLIELHPEQRKMTAQQLVTSSLLVDKTADFTYSKKRSVISVAVINFLRLKDNTVPVETGVQVALNKDRAS